MVSTILIVKAPPVNEVEFLGLKLAPQEKGREFSRYELDEFARKSMTALSEGPAAFVGYQVHYTDAPPPWMAE